MSDILIRGVPEPTHRRLKERAASRGVSLNEMLLREVVELAERPTMAEWIVEVDRRRRSGGPTPSQIVDVIRGGRDER